MGAAAASPLPHDHSSDWVYELQRLTATADSLPVAARVAVLATIGAFHAEDGLLPASALEAQTLLTATVAELHTATACLPSLTETLLEALKGRGQNEPPLRQAHAV
jgi:hypothetical protein